MEKNINGINEIFDKNNLPRFSYGGFFIRFLAFIIDFFIITCIRKIADMPIEIYYKDVTIGLMASDIALVTIMDAIVYYLYFILMTKLNHGQTLGKMICNIRVVSIYGDKLTWGQVITRELFGRYIQDTIWILYIVIAFSSKRQSFVDMLCDTVVLKEDVCTYIYEEKVREVEAAY
ncbi:MAG: RDD family protein [Tissierellia bacterium]|nr:RDD family protein [Tissierellia bacterium]